MSFKIKIYVKRILFLNKKNSCQWESAIAKNKIIIFLKFYYYAAVCNLVFFNKKWMLNLENKHSKNIKENIIKHFCALQHVLFL